MATHSSVLAWRIPGTGEPGGPPSLGSHRVGHDWSDLAAAAAARDTFVMMIHFWVRGWSCVPGCHDIHTKLHGSHFSLLQCQNQCVFPWGVWLSNDGGGGELTWAQFRKPTWMLQHSGVYSGNLLGVWELRGLKLTWWGSVIHVQGTWVRGHQKRISILPSRGLNL